MEVECLSSGQTVWIFTLTHILILSIVQIGLDIEMSLKVYVR